ncbi:MAG: hypothetical protein R3F11_01580 [Verrucomicrobiales bacterium]
MSQHRQPSRQRAPTARAILNPALPLASLSRRAARDPPGGTARWRGRRKRSDLEAAGAWIPASVFRRIAMGTTAGFSASSRAREGVLGDQIMVKQWATARMYAVRLEGIPHPPPHIPDGEDPAAWFQNLFAPGADVGQRPYAREQWDAMFFIQGIAEMLLVDERAGMARRAMRFFIDGDDRPGANNAGVVIPAGVAHAIRCGDSKDLIMVYGTSTTFVPANEGRIASGVESAPLPAEWQDYLNGGA